MQLLIGYTFALVVSNDLNFLYCPSIILPCKGVIILNNRYGQRLECATDFLQKLGRIVLVVYFPPLTLSFKG